VPAWRWWLQLTGEAIGAEAARCRWSSSGGLGGGGGVGGGRTLAVNDAVLVGRGKWRMVSTASVLTVALRWLEARTARWRPPCSPGASAMLLGARRLSAYRSSAHTEERVEARVEWKEEEAVFASRRRLAANKGDKGGARGGGTAWAARGGKEEQVAWGGPAGMTTRWRRGRDRRSIRMCVGRCRFERVWTVALGRAQFIVPNCFPFIQITSKLCNSNSLPFQGPKIFKLCKVLNLNMMNNFVHWLNF
jgi:hypothetical protein